MSSVVGLYPNKLLGVIGDHDDFPVERLRISGDGKLLGSCSHDCLVKFWSLEGLLDVSFVAYIKARWRISIKFSLIWVI